MQILSIGNSFSEDAQRYLFQVAKANGEVMGVYNLYIGGCSLERHFRNMHSGEREYLLEVDGTATSFQVSLKEELLDRDWDVITVQQVSQSAPHYETYQPYLTKLVEYVRICAPKAKIVLQQTWAYEQDSQRLTDVAGYNDYKDMLRDIQAAYQKAAEDIQADYIIPSGELFEALLDNGVEKIHRDTFHASLGLGRYALSLLWYRFITGNDISENTFCDFDEEISAEHITLAKKCVMQLAEKYGR